MSEPIARHSDLMEQIRDAIAEGRSSIVLYGVTPETIHILAELHQGGLGGCVTGLIDEKPALVGKTVGGREVQPLEALSTIAMDALVITEDAKKEQALERISHLESRLPKLIYSGEANYEFSDSALQEIVKSSPIKSKAGGYSNMLVHLYQALRYISERKLTGDVVEFGVFQGGTTVIIAKIMQHFGYARKIYGFDTFAGFPPKSSLLDNYDDAKCEFPDFDTVRDYCAPYNIELIRGDIKETYKHIEGLPLSLCFFDTDNYSATRLALENCWEQLLDGGVLAFDHWYSPGWNKTIGERIAIRQVLDGKRVFNLHGTGIFLKI